MFLIHSGVALGSLRVMRGLMSCYGILMEGTFWERKKGDVTYEGEGWEREKRDCTDEGKVREWKGKRSEGRGTHAFRRRGIHCN